MGKYFIVQIKRLGRILPLLLCVMALLLGGLYLAYRSVVSRWSDPERFEKISVGMVGTANDRILTLGLNALKSMDNSNVSVEFLQMEEKEAVTALETGAIAAYVVFPEEFMDKAMGGQITPLRFVSAAGGENIVSMVKDELTSALAEMLMTSEKGAFALGDVLDENGHSDLTSAKMNEIALKYAIRIMERSEVYTVEELGISQGLTFEIYMMSGLSVVFLFLITLPFVTLFVKEEPGVEQLLKSKRIGAVSQVICEMGTFSLFLFLLTLLPLLAFGLPVHAAVRLVPVVFCICAISYFLFALTKDIISGVLLPFTVFVAMCFVSGCMYPVFFFPVSVQKFSRFLPAAMARDLLAGMITGDKTWNTAIPLAATGLLLIVASAVVRYLRIRGRKGARL